MNESISSQALPFEYGAYLENILPQPLGEGRVRHGVKSICSLDIGVRIEKIFSYPSANQLILFVRAFEKEGSIEQTWVQTPSSLEVRLQDDKTLERYQAGTDIKVIYEYAGTHEIILPIRESLIDKEKKRIDLEFTDNSFPVAGEDLKIKELYYPVGCFYLYDVKTKKSSKLHSDPCFVHTPMNAVLYRNRLLLTNGIDPVMMWDGKKLTQLKELPRFKRLFSHKNRLWGTRLASTEGMYAYFMRAPDALPEVIDAWGLDAKSKMPPFIDLSLKGRQDDEVIAIEELGDKMIFFCKHHLQVWKARIMDKDYNFITGFDGYRA